MTKPRREHGTGSMYQRRSDWRWVATIEANWSANDTRRRLVVTGKGCEGGCAPRCLHRADINKKLERKKNEYDRGQIGTSARETVKGWADKYLAMRLDDLSPKGYNAASSPIRKWVVPTIGRKRLDQLAPADLRAVADAQREAGRKPATVEATHRAMMTMLRYAVREGYVVPPIVMAAKPPPKAGKSDRIGMTVPEGMACIEQASKVADGTRWLVTLLYGMRQGECLGLTWDAIDFDAGEFGEIRIEWQLQPLPYLDRSNKRLGFRVPVGYEAIHLVDAYHLVRPKSAQGYRVAPLLPPVREALIKWREVAPKNKHGLVWPEANGRPKNDKHDRAAWGDLQAAAKVAHPSGRAYHVHECRNFAATLLLEAGVDEHIITALLGHSSIVMSRRYMTVRREPLLEALTRVGDRLQLG